MTSKEKPSQINFTLNVVANDIDPYSEDCKIKVVIDFAPPFNGENNSGGSIFHANKVQRLLTFISDRVLKKVVESVYYDRDNATYAPAYGLKLPVNYKNAIDIYDERRTKKKGNGDTSHLDIRERKSKDDDTNCIECIVDDFLKDPERPVWSKEVNVTRITFEQQSPPSLTVETRTVVNGDKKPK
jgi:hypothetical protein